MRVTVDEEIEEFSLCVYLDSGEEVGRYCVVDEPELERDDLERTIRRCVVEALTTARPGSRRCVVEGRTGETPPRVLLSGTVRIDVEGGDGHDIAMESNDLEWLVETVRRVQARYRRRNDNQ
jgi:hypothetical protein